MFNFATSTTVDSAPAGGAALDQVFGASAAALLATAALLYLGWAHRTGRTNLLRKVAGFAARDTGFAPWAALPSLIAAGALLIALLGMYWDISLHIDDGRDPGPLANPAHYLILVGLFGIFSAGFLAIVLPEGKPSPRAIRIAGDWYAPLGGVAMLAASAFALIGFPLDDVWHRIFGQDVTLWGPTHLMLIGGAGLTLVGSAILIIEGRGDEVSAPSAGRLTALADRVVAGVARYRRAFAMGGLLIGLSTFQAEFDFGVPQFQLVLEPIMLAFAAGVALVAARIWIGRGGALGAAIFFIAVRGAIALIVGDVFDQTMPHLPLYLVEALCVEGVALVVSPRRGYAFGAAAGVLIGTVGLLAEYAWSHVWMPIPWPSSLLGEAIVPALVTAIAAGVLGAYLGGSFAAGGSRRERFAPPPVLPAALATVAIVAAVGLNIARPDAQRLERAGDPRRRRLRRPADRQRDRAPEPALDRRRRLLAAGDRLAGRRARRRPPGSGLARRLSDHEADPGERHLEGADPPAARQLRRRRADLPARGLGDPRACRARPAELRPAVRRRDADPPARAEVGRARLPGRDRLLDRRRDRARAAAPPRLGAQPHRPPGGRPRPPRPVARPPALGREGGDGVSALPLAHAGHWLMGIGFAGAPLTVVGGIFALAWRERRRERAAGSA